MLIFPDIQAETMELVLDYIYTGSAAIHPSSLLDFLCLADFLQLHLDKEQINNLLLNININSSYKCAKLDVGDYIRCDRSDHPCHSDADITSQNRSHNTLIQIENNDSGISLRTDVVAKRTQKKLPNLMPISSMQNKVLRVRRGLYNHVIPSPWCPRVAPLMVDPREDCLSHTEQTVSFCIMC